MVPSKRTIIAPTRENNEPARFPIPVPNKPPKESVGTNNSKSPVTDITIIIPIIPSINFGANFEGNRTSTET